MKTLLLVFSTMLSLNLYASALTGINGVLLEEAKCEVSTTTGKTVFTFGANDDEGHSLTDSLFGRGVKDHYYKPYVNILSKTGDQDPLSYGPAFISFTIKPDSASANNYGSYEFVLKELPKLGTKVYEVTLLGTTSGGWPNVGQTYYHEIGEGSCEINLIKK